MDWLMKWVDASAVRNKTAQSMAQLVVNEIFPRVEAVAGLITDNRGEFVNGVMRETLKFEYQTCHHFPIPSSK